jgi:hypothetical protein
MDGNEIMEVEDFGAMATAFRNDDVDALMRMSGQGAQQQQKVGLPRLNINYEAETEEGISLVRGTWKLNIDGQFIYADKVTVRPLLRTFEYSLWDNTLNEGRGGFAAKSVQKTSFGGTFPDSAGGNKCGRLSKDEEAALDKDDAEYLNSRAVVCNQVIYGRITGEFKNAQGDLVTLTDEPMIAYFKRSGFKPIADFIDGLTKNNKLMAQVEMNLTTSRNKNGSVTYWTPVAQMGNVVSISDDDKDLFALFAETVKGHNDSVMKDYREAKKASSVVEDVDLAAEFDNADAA